MSSFLRDENYLLDLLMERNAITHRCTWHSGIRTPTDLPVYARLKQDVAQLERPFSQTAQATLVLSDGVYSGSFQGFQGGPHRARLLTGSESGFHEPYIEKICPTLTATAP